MCLAGRVLSICKDRCTLSLFVYEKLYNVKATKGPNGKRESTRPGKEEQPLAKNFLLVRTKSIKNRFLCNRPSLSLKARVQGYGWKAGK